MSLLDQVDSAVRTILDRALDGQEISWQEALRLCETTGPDFHAMVFAADELRRRQVGDVVTYVINRNINFTNVCVKHCGFCAFSRTFRSEQAYYLPMEEILRRVQEAVEAGAEVGRVDRCSHRHKLALACFWPASSRSPT